MAVLPAGPSVLHLCSQDHPAPMEEFLAPSGAVPSEANYGVAVMAQRGHSCVVTAWAQWPYVGVNKEAVNAKLVTAQLPAQK
jgi:hypothetical protein